MGRAFVLGDDIDTDVIAPGAYLMLDPAEMASHCLEAVRPDFAPSVERGDVLFAGKNFGLGSSRELAAAAIKELGISCVLARSFARIFYRNCINLGLPALLWPEEFSVEEGDAIEIDPSSGMLVNLTQGLSARTVPLPDHLLEIVQNGGLIAHLKKEKAKSA
ncbi:3-isopropylmalate dehydratase small subunit [Altererythrobacter sp. GH1-8]|uniref:LeuD/DmdB family oxidoreductase small subunit n=1 Tax=Altererythrobacter sp. GH1-8 TaxID=3349333 RepID=UPI00374DA69C